MQLVFLPAAIKSLQRIAPQWRSRIRQKMESYAVDPSSLSNNVVRLQGTNKLRMRVGDYRVIFTEDGVVIQVQDVGHRGDVYRRGL